MPQPTPDGAPPVLVRPAREDEYADVGALTVEAYQADRLLTGDEGYVPVLVDAARRATHADLIVAVDPDTEQLLGTVTFCLHGTAYAEVAQDGEAEFRMLAVSPDARRRGVGEALVRACVARARALGAHRIVLSTLPSMHAAHALYGRLGFSREPARDWGVGDVWLISYTLPL